MLSFEISSLWSRQSNALEKSVNKAPNIFPQWMACIHFFYQSQNTLLCTKPFPEATLLSWQKVIKKLDICANALLSNTFGNVTSILTCLQFPFKSSLPFLLLSVLLNWPNDLAVLWVLIFAVHLTVWYYHVTYSSQSESTLYSCLNVKELLARNRRDIWSLSNSAGNHIHSLIW